jgi:hypothetical protein
MQSAEKKCIVLEDDLNGKNDLLEQMYSQTDSMQEQFDSLEIERETVQVQLN